MKIRNGFVSNSSSSSYTVTETCYTCGADLTIFNRSDIDHCCKSCKQKTRKKKLEIIDMLEKAEEDLNKEIV